MTLRIFLWSNLAGIPWTVVKVLRPLRSVNFPVSPYLFPNLQRDLMVTRQRGMWKKRTLNADMDVLLGLSSLPRVFVGFGEGVCKGTSSQRLHP